MQYNKNITEGENAMKIAAILVFFISLFISCENGTTSEGIMSGSFDGRMTFNEVVGKEWLLSEIRNAGNTVQIDRAKLKSDHMGDFFSIRFRGGNVNGTAAPNLYSGPYTSGSSGELSIGDLISTLMALEKEFEALTEYEYFGYLNNVTHWNLSGGKLELYSSNPDGAEAVLGFTVK